MLAKTQVWVYAPLLARMICDIFAWKVVHCENFAIEKVEGDDMRKKLDDLYFRCVRVENSLEMLSLSAEQIDNYTADHHTRMLSALADAIKLVSIVQGGIANDIERLMDEVASTQPEPGEPEPGTPDNIIDLVR